MKTTEINIEAKIKDLKSRLKWKNDHQRWATDGHYLLIVTIGINDSLFTLVDGDDNIIEKWNEQ